VHSRQPGLRSEQGSHGPDQQGGRRDKEQERCHVSPPATRAAPYGQPPAQHRPSQAGAASRGQDDAGTVSVRLPLRHDDAPPTDQVGQPCVPRAHLPGGMAGGRLSMRSRSASEPPRSRARRSGGTGKATCCSGRASRRSRLVELATRFVTVPVDASPGVPDGFATTRAAKYPRLHTSPRSSSRLIL
jgi:hypothetical protein